MWTTDILVQIIRFTTNYDSWQQLNMEACAGGRLTFINHRPFLQIEYVDVDY